jgi:hypothetical protein
MMASWCCIFSMTIPERLYIREPSTMTGMFRSIRFAPLVVVGVPKSDQVLIWKRWLTLD